MSATADAGGPVAVVPRRRRGVELAMLAFALVLGLGAYAQVDLNVTGGLGPGFVPVAAGCVVAVLLAHLAVRWRLPYADPLLLPCVVVLNGLGLAMIDRKSTRLNSSHLVSRMPSSA